MAPKFTKLMSLLGLMTFDAAKCSVSGRYITVKFIVGTNVVSTYKVSDNVYWEVK